MYRLIRWFCLFACFACSAETVVIGTQSLRYFPHYDFTSEQDKGLAWAIFEAFKAKTGYDVVYVTMPVLRLQKELFKGSVDLIYPDNPKWYNPVIDASVKTFSKPVTRALGGTIMRPETVGSGINKVQRLAMPLGFTPVNWQQRVDKKLTHLIRVTNTFNALELIYLERADAANLEFNVTQYIAKTNPQLGTFTLDPKLPHDRVAFMLSTIKNTSLIEEFNQFLAENHELIDALHKEYKVSSPESILEQLNQQFYPSIR